MLTPLVMDPMNKITLSTPKTNILAFRMLKIGRADYLLTYDALANEALKEVPIPDLKHSDISILKVYFIIKKRMPKAKEIMKKII